MNNSRIIGNNISLELMNRSMELSVFAQKIDFSMNDIHKLIEGRLFLPPFQLKKIADTLGVSKSDLMTDKGSGEYDKLIHNFRDFKKPENQELVLDLIDMYADLAEALQ